MTDEATQSVLVVEDDADLRLATVQTLELAGLAVRAFAEAGTALACITPDFDGAVVSDIRMPRMDGLQLLCAIRAVDADIPVILVTGHGDVPMAVAALKDGAYDFLTKPFAADHLLTTVRRGLERRELIVENRRLRAEANASDSESPLIGIGDAAVQLRADVRRLANAGIDVLIEGETGTGKDLAALLLHRQSARRARPFIAVDCAALADDTAESELFGHATDSVPYTRLSRRGQIAVASGGTLLLDHVDRLPFILQAKLLRVIEDREVRPIGASRADAVDLRVVATSDVDLGVAAARGQFSDDLYHALSVARLVLPPLRERGRDRLVLFAAFVEEAKARLGHPDFAISDFLRRQVLTHRWPGNVRELRSFAFDAVLVKGRLVLGEPATDLRSQIAEFEATIIADALRAVDGNVTKVLSRLNLPRKTLYDKLSRHGIDPSDFRKTPSKRS